MQSILFTTDLHFTDNPREEYRFEIFSLLRKLVNERRIPYCFILGDLTDRTDHHSSWLVNTLISHLTALSRDCDIFILRGNHDCVNEKMPFFQFTQYIDRIRYITSPQKIRLEDKNLYLLPNSRNPMEDWKDLELSKADIICMHQTIEGAKSENGSSLRGCNPEIFSGFKEIYSGDVHVPQRLGNLLYVGSPYHVHFGDTFEPVVRIRHTDGHIEDIPTEMKSRHMWNLLTLDELGLHPYKKGDQAKIRLNVHSTEWKNWLEIKTKAQNRCEEMGVELFDITPVILDTKTIKSKQEALTTYQQSPKQIVEKFLQAKYPNVIGPYAEAGIGIIKSVDGI